MKSVWRERNKLLLMIDLLFCIAAIVFAVIGFFQVEGLYVNVTFYLLGTAFIVRGIDTFLAKQKIYVMNLGVGVFILVIAIMTSVVL